MPQVKLITEFNTERPILVEFQGKIETSAPDLRGLELGDLTLCPNGPVLVIGSQRLVGKIVSLKKPLAVLEPSVCPEDGTTAQQLFLIKLFHPDLQSLLGKQDEPSTNDNRLKRVKMLKWVQPLWLALRFSGFRGHIITRFVRSVAWPNSARNAAESGVIILGGLWGWFGWSYERPSIVDGVSKVLPSTVQIRVEMSGKRIAHADKILLSNGTGFVVRPDGLILTNAHVVGDSLEGGRIRLIYYDGASVWGEMVAFDLESDLALVRPLLESQSSSNSSIELARYPPVHISEARVHLGEAVAALGNPLGLRNSVAVGVVGGVNRTNEDARQPDSRVKYIQTDLHTNPGSSGGPLLTANGQVIGMITTRADVEGISFAIQLDSVKDMINQLAEKQSIFRPWLGIKGLSLTPELVLQVTDARRRELLSSLKSGLLVTKIHKTSPGNKTPLRPGDIITHVNDLSVTCLGDILLQVTPINPKLKLTVTRIVDGKTDLDSQKPQGLETVSFTLNLVADEFDILFKGTPE